METNNVNMLMLQYSDITFRINKFHRGFIVYHRSNVANLFSEPSTLKLFYVI